MGRRGPARAAKEILKLRGSKRAKRRESAPDADGRRPRRPQWLTGEGRAVWDRLVKRLEQMGVLDSVDREALARYCTLWVRWREAEKELKSGEAVIESTTKEGNPYLQQSPWVGIANKLAVELRRLEQEFGMTPAARARVEVKPQKPAGETGVLGFAKSKGA